MTPEGREQVRVWRSNGVNQADIARQLGIGPRSFRDLLDRDEDLKDAYEAGSGQAESELVGILMRQAREGNTTAAIFLLKGAHGFREATPVAPKNDTAPTVNITIPPSLSADDLSKLTASMRDVTPADQRTDEPTPNKRKKKELIR